MIHKTLLPLICFLACLHLAGCKKKDEETPKTPLKPHKVRYETQCNSNYCRIEYNDIVDLVNVVREPAGGNITVELEVVNNGAPLRKDLYIRVTQLDTPKVPAKAWLYINDTLVDANGTDGYGYADNF